MILGSVNWQHPVNWSHRLNRGRLLWLLVTPYDRGGTVLRDIVNQSGGALTATTPVPWSNETRRGGWGHVTLDGTDGTIGIGAPTALDNIGSVTLACRIRLTASLDFDNVATKRGSASVGEWYINGQGTNALGYNANTSGTNIFTKTDNSVLVNNTWHHLVITHTGIVGAGQCVFYVDGVPVGLAQDDTSTGTIDDDAGETIYFGSRDDSSGYINANIDDIGVWDHVLGPVEVKDLDELGQDFQGDMLTRIAMPRWQNQAAPVGTLLRPHGMDGRCNIPAMAGGING